MRLLCDGDHTFAFYQRIKTNFTQDHIRKNPTTQHFYDVHVYLKRIIDMLNFKMAQTSILSLCPLVKWTEKKTINMNN